MRWLTQQRRQIRRPPRSHSARALRPQQGAMNRDHDPPLGNFCNVTGVAVSRSPSRITVEVVSAVIAPEARKREIRRQGKSSRKIRMPSFCKLAHRSLPILRTRSSVPPRDETMTLPQII
jgi:hypothetical protein